MQHGTITFNFDIKAFHYLNSNSSYIKATADATGDKDIAHAALQYYKTRTSGAEIQLKNEDDVSRFMHVARRYFSEN